VATPQPNPPAITLDPAFKLVLIIVTSLTVVLLFVMIGLAITGATNDASKNLFDTCSTGFKIGLGAIVGLLGGKAL
jgi:hypothetical protein